MRSVFFLLLFVCPVWGVPIEHGQIEAVASPFSVTLVNARSPGVSLDQVRSNPGDYHVDLSEFAAWSNGVMMVSVRQNMRNVYGVTAGAFVSSLSGYNQYFLPQHHSQHPAIESNWDLAFAWFNYDDWLAGFTYNSSFANNAAADRMHGSTNLVLGTHVVEHRDGTFTIDLREFDASSQHGVLMVTQTRNEDNFALSKAQDDGTFTAYCRDNAIDQAYETDQISFVYVPTDRDHEQVAAVGRIRGDGETILGRGMFHIDALLDGKWNLSIPGHTPDTGTLLVSPEGGDPINNDNIITYEWDAGNEWWEVHRHDVVTELGALFATEDLGEEPAFSFVFVVNPPTIHYVNQTATNGVNDGSSWSNAYVDLQSALAVASSGDHVWVAGGVYKPGFFRTDSFKLPRGVRVYGGFRGTETSLEERAKDPLDVPTVLSGNIGNPDNVYDNCYHVVELAFSPFGDPQTFHVLDGFVIRDGFANGAGVTRRSGGGIYVSTWNGFQNGAAYQIRNCHVLENYALEDGGGLHLYRGKQGQVLQTRIEGNRSDRNGGGIYAYSVDCALDHLVVAGNSAVDHGGGLYVDNVDGPMTHCSLVGNEAGDAGGLYSEGSSVSNGHVSVYNSVLWGNTATSGTNAQMERLYVSEIGASLIQGSGGSAAWDSTLGTDMGGNIDADPDLARMPSSGDGDWSTLADNDYGDLRLAPQSAAINAGSNDWAITKCDGLGNERILFGTTDIGAYEFNPLSVSISSVFATTNGVVDMRANWATVSPSSSTGLVYTFELVDVAGSLSFFQAPSVTSSNLSFGLDAGTSGSSLWRLKVSDPDGPLAPTSWLPFSLRTPSQTLFVDQSASGLGQGVSWNDAFPDLQDAFGSAQSGDEIWIAEGVYTPGGSSRDDHFRLVDQVAVYGGFPAGGSNFADRDTSLSSSVVVLSGARGEEGTQSDNTRHVLIGDHLSTNTVLDGVVVERGYASGTSLDASKGGGLLLRSNSVLVVRNVMFRENAAVGDSDLAPGHVARDGYGGAVAVLNSTGHFYSCIFDDNDAGAITATTGKGGNALGGAVFARGGSLGFWDCVFDANVSVGGTGMAGTGGGQGEAGA